MGDLDKVIIKEIRKVGDWLEKIYHLFAKYDSQALQELEDARAAESKSIRNDRGKS